MDEEKDRFQEIRRAYKERDVDASKKAHQIPISQKERKFELGTYLNDMVLAAIDGIVTTFAVVSGVAGAGLHPNIILILGFANLFADGSSMTIGNYLGMKAKQRYIEKERLREEWEVESIPEEERREVLDILKVKGVSQEDRAALLKLYQKYPEIWIDFMMSEELDLPKPESRETTHALVTWIAFTLFGCIPLIAPIMGYFSPDIKEHEFTLSILFTSAALAVVGIVRARVTLEKWWQSTFQILFLGGVAAAIAYGVGYLLKGLI